MPLNWRGPSNPVQGWVVLHVGGLSVLAGLLGLGLESGWPQRLLAIVLLVVGVVFCVRGVRLVRTSSSNK